MQLDEVPSNLWLMRTTLLPERKGNGFIETVLVVGHARQIQFRRLGRDQIDVQKRSQRRARPRLAARGQKKPLVRESGINAFLRLPGGARGGKPRSG